MVAAAENTTLPAWQQRLAERGILDAALEAHWEYFVWGTSPGWKFPLHRSDGKQFMMPDTAGVAKDRPQVRWKALDSNAEPKYLWGYKDQSRERNEVRQNPSCQFYWMPTGTVKQDIQASGGKLIIACGEPDMLSFVSAKHRNVTSFFGEGNIPATLVESLKKLGATEILYYPDSDSTGWDDAAKIMEMLDGSGIEFSAYGLPDEVLWSEVKDINDLWVACSFDPVEFDNQLAQCRKINDLLKLSQKQEPAVNNDAAWVAYQEQIEQALHAAWKGAQTGWSRYFPCPFGHHENDDKHPKATYHREKHVLRCFKCAQTWLGDEVAEKLGIPKPKPVLQLVQPDYIRKNPSATPEQPQALPEIPIHSSGDSLRRYQERIRGINPKRHIPFPLRSLHRYGGLCQVIPHGKMIGILGLSGGGKTSLLETMNDAWRQMAFNSLWWGPEWTWEEMADRSVQRWGGLSMTDMMLHELALSEEARNTPARDRIGVKQPESEIRRTLAIIETIMAWPGESYYLDKMGLTIDQLLGHAQNKLDALAADGRAPEVAFFDYIQLAQVDGGNRGDAERITRALTGIKSFTSDNPLISVVGTQTRKNDSEGAREDGKLLTAEAAQFFRDDMTNLFITLNPEFDDEGNMTGQGWMNIVKNSGGRKGKVQAAPDPARLRWLDVALHTETFNLNPATGEKE